jgi:hypothetical protein
MLRTEHEAHDGYPLRTSSINDLIILMHIVQLGVSRLPAESNIGNDLAALRRELRTRELAVAA